MNLRARQTTFRIGLLMMWIVSFVLLGTACIFDQGDFKGGGRIGQAATAQQDKVGTSSSSGDDDDTTSSSTSSSSTSSSSGGLDAGLGGDR